MGCIRNSMNESLSVCDPELFNLITKEKKRQIESLEMIASENYPSYSTLQCLSSCLNNTYGKMIHKNNEGDVEKLCAERCLRAFGLNGSEWGVNVRAPSAAIANFAVFMALCKPHDRIMGLDYLEGGHYSHGFMKTKEKISATSIFFETFPFKLDPKTGLIDYDKMAENARIYSPKIIVAGISCYSRCLNYKKFREIADEVGAFLVADTAHVSGLVATGLIDSPFDYCDVVTTSTYKNLRGTKGSVIFYKNRVNIHNENGGLEEYDLENLISQAVFPGITGAPMIHAIAAIASAMHHVSLPSFKRYQAQVLVNAKRLCTGLQSLGYEIVTGGTDIHMMLVNIKPQGLTGQQAEFVLEHVNISVTTFPIPGDSKGPHGNGLRIGSPALTTRGLSETDFDKVVNFFNDAIKIGVEIRSKSIGDSFEDFKIIAQKDQEIVQKLEQLKLEISLFARQFPIPGMEATNL